MHKEAWDWLEHCWRMTTNKSRAGTILEVGSYNHNGTARVLFTPISDLYFGVDIISGPGVDGVFDITNADDFAQVQAKYNSFDMVICTETLEHTPAEPLVNAMVGLLNTNAPVSRMIITCAGPLRQVHSYDGGPLKPDEFYKGITAEDIHAIVMEALYLHGVTEKTHTLFVDSSLNHDMREEDSYYYLELTKK